LGRTVENTLTKHKERIQRAAHHSIPAFIGRNWTVENTLRPTQKKSQRAAHHSIPAFIGRNCRTVEKYS
jgi:hypothetical protein